MDDLDQLNELFDQSKLNYYQLILVVGRTGTNKTKLLQNFCRSIDLSITNINLELSSRMLELSGRARALRASSIVTEIINQNGYPIVLDNIEALFSNDLKLNPLSLLRNLSRNGPIITSWPGYFENSKLHYAEIGHPEYKEYDIDGISRIDLN
jgi:replicative DNA helicase